jgi:hypothetical protein
VHPPAITAIPRPGGGSGKFWPSLHCDAMTVAKHKTIAAGWTLNMCRGALSGAPQCSYFYENFTHCPKEKPRECIPYSRSLADISFRALNHLRFEMVH